MIGYRMFFMNCPAQIEAREEFDADDDVAATTIAAEIFEACSDHYAAFELWAGARKVASGNRPRCFL